MTPATDPTPAAAPADVPSGVPADPPAKVPSKMTEPMDAPAGARARIEWDVIRILAGNVAGRKCQEGSAPGWRLPRTWDQIKSYHEANHIVMGQLGGLYSYHVDIVDVPQVRGGVAWSGTEPVAPGPIPMEKSKSDLEKAAEWCQALALTMGWQEGGYRSDYTGWWKCALRIYHELKRRTERLTADYWPEIKVLADAILQHKLLDQEAIARVRAWGSAFPAARPVRTAADDAADAALRQRGYERLQELLALEKARAT